MGAAIVARVEAVRESPGVSMGGAWLTSADHHSPYARLSPDLRWWRSDHNSRKALHADDELTAAAPPPTNEHRHCAPRVLRSLRSPQSSARQLEVRLDEIGEEFGFDARAVGVDVAAVFPKLRVGGHLGDVVVERHVVALIANVSMLA